MLATIMGSGSLTPAETLLAAEAPPDSQEATIKETLTEAGAALGWDIGDCIVHTPPVEGATPVRR